MLTMTDSSELDFLDSSSSQSSEIRLTSVRENRSKIFRDMIISSTSQIVLNLNRKDLYIKIVSQHDDSFLLQDRDKIFFVDLKNCKTERLKVPINLSEENINIIYIQPGRFIAIDRNNYYFIDIENPGDYRYISARDSRIDILDLNNKKLIYITNKDNIIELYDSSFNLIDSGISSITENFYLKKGEIYSLYSGKKVELQIDKEEKLTKSIYSSRSLHKNSTGGVDFLVKNRLYIFESQNLGVISSRNIQPTAIPEILLLKDSNIVLDIDTAIAFQYQTEVKLSSSRYPITDKYTLATPYGPLTIDSSINDIQSVFSRIYSKHRSIRCFLIEDSKNRYFFTGSSLSVKTEYTSKTDYNNINKKQDHRYDIFHYYREDQEYRFIALYRDDTIFLVNNQTDRVYTIDISKYSKVFINFQLNSYQPEKEKIIYTIEHYPSHKTTIKEINIIEQDQKEEKLLYQFREDETLSLFSTYSYKNVYRLKETENYTTVDLYRIQDDHELFYSIDGESYIINSGMNVTLNYKGENFYAKNSIEAEIIYRLLEKNILILQDSSREPVYREDNTVVVNSADQYLVYLKDRYLITQSLEDKKYRIIDLEESKMLDKSYSSIYRGDNTAILVEESSTTIKLIELNRKDAILEIEKDSSPSISIPVDIS